MPVGLAVPVESLVKMYTSPDRWLPASALGELRAEDVLTSRVYVLPVVPPAPVPSTGMSVGELTALLVSASVPWTSPAATGANRTTTLDEAPGPSVSGSDGLVTDMPA